MLDSVCRFVVACLLAACASAAGAVGTRAGTVIANTVTLSYSVEGQAQPAVTATAATLRVAELINLTLAWQDAAPVQVVASERDRALMFLLINTGNSAERFALSRNNALPGDDYDPLNGSTGAIFMENGRESGFQASGLNADLLYVPGVNDPLLDADAALILYLVSDTPAQVGSTNISRGDAALIARSATPGAAGAVPGTALVGQGNGGVDAVVGASGAQASVAGRYAASSVAVTVAKSVVATVDPQGGVLVMPGSVITYRIVLAVAGSGIAQSLVLDDPIPVNMTYVANSLTVDGVVRTDAADTDNVEVIAGIVKARFGNTNAPATRRIEFRVTVN
jgi:uncharacterized repeat protein (TIGR01451 family)